MARLRPTRPVRDNFQRLMPRLLRRYFKIGRGLVQAQASGELLHRFRIRTKRLRYITELYDEVFPEALRGCLQQYRGIQELLGSIQDQRMLQAWLARKVTTTRVPAARIEYGRLLQQARLREAALRVQFFQRWEKLEASGFEKRILSRIKRIPQ